MLNKILALLVSSVLTLSSIGAYAAPNTGSSIFNNAASGGSGGSGTVTSVATNNGLTGGTITATGTVGLASTANNTALCNNSGSSAAPTSANCTVTGTGNAVLGTGPTLSNPIVGTQSASDNSTKGASTAYVTTAVANAIAAVNPAMAVQAATTQASDTSGFTYNNGVAGIGAFFTGSVNTAVAIDGFTFTTLGQRLLVKNDTQSPSGAFNGIYYVTQVQTGILAPILTRALDYDQASDINNTGAIPVVNGTVNASTSWLETATVNTVGTDPFTFVKFSVNPTTVQLTKSVNSISGNTNAGSSSNTDYVYKCTSTLTLTLPTAVGNTNRYSIKNTGGTTTIATTSAQTIDGSSTVTLSVTNTSLDVVSDGSNWIIL